MRFSVKGAITKITRFCRCNCSSSTATNTLNTTNIRAGQKRLSTVSTNTLSSSPRVSSPDDYVPLSRQASGTLSIYTPPPQSTSPEPIEYDADFSPPPKSITPESIEFVVEQSPSSSFKYKSYNGNQANIKINTGDSMFCLEPK